MSSPNQTHTATVSLRPSDDAPTIRPEIYGHFAEHLGRCIYEGLWVGEDSPIPNRKGIRIDVVDALKALDIPVLRWPGGCFADEYHWKDGVGPREARKRIYNSHWGGVVETNHFGTHEFFELCEQLGCKAYVCANVGSGTVQEMQEWVEYITSPAESPMADWRRANGREEPWRLHYLGVGNESWGCGGNMRPEYYADEYRRYSTFVRTYGPHKIEKIACGANVADYRWTEVLTEQAHRHMDGLSLHHYSFLGNHWPPKGSATAFSRDDWFSILRAARYMEELVTKHSDVMDKHDPDRRIGMVVDEWGTWHPVEEGTNPGFLYQQNALRDAMVAVIHLHLFARHAGRVSMANIAQFVNVLQAMVLTDGPRMLVTPTYWVFEMFKGHQGGRFIDLDTFCEEVDGVPTVDFGASRQGETVILTGACLDPERGATVTVSGLEGLRVKRARILTGPAMTAHNTFDRPDEVTPTDFAAFRVGGEALTIEMPAMSVVAFKLAR